jgi:hypothetical protein
MATLAAVKSVQSEATAQSPFRINMTAMTEFYKEGTLGGPTHTFSLPVSLLQSLKELPQSDPALNALKQASLAAGAGSKALTLNIQANVTSALAQLQASGDTSAFNQQIYQAEAQAKEQSDTNIQNYFNSLITIGDQYPSAQSRILTGSNSAGSFVSNFLSSVASFFQNLYTTVVNAIKAAVQWIEQAAETVANWVSGAVQTVEDFFSNLF